MSSPPSTLTLHVRGHAAKNRPAALPALALSLSIDFGFLLAALALAFLKLQWSPVPRFWLPPAIFAGFLAVFWVERRLLGRTLGERALGLAAEPGKPLSQLSRIPAGTWVRGIFLTIAVYSGAAYFAEQILSTHPLLLAGENWRLEAFLPNEREWTVSPFFYTLGAWPKKIQGKAVFYSIPYELGPPTRFPGHLRALWSAPDIVLNIEGPKTAMRVENREAIARCVLAQSYDCLYLREALLGRHLKEMSEVLSSSPGAVHWQIRWFKVANGALPDPEQAQGIYLSAHTRTRGQDRFVLVTAKGTQQAFSLDYSNTPEAERARALLVQAISSLRVSDELGPGRAWVDQRLEATRLGELSEIAPSNHEQALKWVEKIAEIQALLVAKISVDPATYESYYHLGGTSYLFASHFAKGPDAQPQEYRGLVKTMAQNLRSMHRFARDISPNHSRTGQLEAYATEAEKY